MKSNNIGIEVEREAKAKFIATKCFFFPGGEMFDFDFEQMDDWLDR